MQQDVPKTLYTTVTDMADIQDGNAVYNCKVSWKIRQEGPEGPGTLT